MDNNEIETYTRAYAEQFAEERRRSGKTFDELAVATGISRSTLQRYAAGTRDIGAVDLIRFLDAVNVDMHKFVDRASARIATY